MKYKLIAIDLDDTLLNKKMIISERSQLAIQAAVAKGVAVTVSTGRMYISSVPYIHQLDIQLPVIVYNGAMILDSATGQMLRYLPVSLQEAHEIIAMAQEEHVYVQTYYEDKCYTSASSKESEAYRKHTNIEPIPVGDLLSFTTAEPTKIVIIAAQEKIPHLRRIAEERWGKELELTISKPTYLEFLNKKASKGEAVRFLAERMGIQREEVMAFGDSENDLSMIEYAGTGVVMGNARDTIKQHADLIAPPNDQDGVAQIIEKYVLK